MLGRGGLLAITLGGALLGGAAACHTTIHDDDAVDAGRDAATSPSDPVEAGAPDAARPEPPLLPATSGTTAALRAVWIAADASIAVAVGDGGTIVSSKDGGRSWVPATSGVTEDLLGVWGASAAEVWVCGKNGTVLRSSDGAAWSKVTTFGAATTVVGVWGSSADQVFFLGANGKSYRTRDHGQTFEGFQAPNGLAMVGISGTSAKDLWAVAASNMFHSTDDGETFTAVSTNLAQTRGIWAGGPEDVYTVNELSVVTRFDGKALYKNALQGPKLTAVWGSAPNDVYVVGEQALVRHSIDRNSRWASVAGASGDLHGVGGNQTTVLVVGAGGGIFRR